MEADRTVAIYSLPRLLGILRDTYNDDARHSIADVIAQLCAVDLLHIDDVGAEQSSPWVLEQLYTIVNTRYEDGRAVLVTTNLITPEEHGEVPLREQIGDRTVSRLNEICGEVLFMMGHDHRMDAHFDLPPAPVAEPEVDLAYGRPMRRPFRTA